MRLLAGILILAGSWTCNAKDPSPRELFRISLDGTGRESIAPVADLCYGSPRFSRDGSKIAFDAWPRTKKFSVSAIYTMNPNGTDLREYPMGALPSWSPDGKKIVMRTHTSTNQSNFAVVNLADARYERLPAMGNGPNWSPDGKSLVYREIRANVLRLSLYDFETKQKRPLTDPPLFPWYGGRWSPDGTMYGFPNSSIGGLPDEIVVAKLDESKKIVSTKSIAKIGDVFTNLSWSPDGKTILFSGRHSKKEKYQMYLVDVEGKNPPTSFPGQDPKTHNIGPTWSPVEDYIVYVCEPVFPQE